MKNLALSYSTENLIVKCQHNFHKALADMEDAIEVLENSDLDFAEKIAKTQEIVSYTVRQLEELERHTSTFLGENTEDVRQVA